MIVDGLWCCIGSTNFDDRSFQLNDEITVGYIDRDMAKQLRAAYERDRKDSVEIEFDEWRTRPWRHRLIDGAAYLARREL